NRLRLRCSHILRFIVEKLQGLLSWLWPDSPNTVRDRRSCNRELLRDTYPGLFRDMPLAVVEFCDEAIDKCLKRRFTLWRWMFTRKESGRLYEKRYKRALEVATEKADREFVDEIWRLVTKRRQLDLEYRLHALGRLWLLVHGPAALAMLVFLAEHVVMSMRF